MTPADAGALAVLREALEALGFVCRPMPFGDIDNLYARLGTARPNLCFAGHTDVVPVGDAAAWSQPPFEAALADGVLIGRGAADMKSSIAAFVAATARALAGGGPAGSISLLITGDEEGLAEHGTKAMVAALAAEGEIIDHCLVGEPTSSAVLGDMIKIGRRGSVGAVITVEGCAGPCRLPAAGGQSDPGAGAAAGPAAGPRPRRRLRGLPAVQPRDHLHRCRQRRQQCHPRRAEARLNIRFNPGHTGAALASWLQAEGAAAGEGFAGQVTVETRINGEAFLTPRGAFTDVVSRAVESVTGRAGGAVHTGGTSDARFIRALCPVVEFGLVGATMHQVDERAPVADIQALAGIFERLIADYFEVFGEAPSTPSGSGRSYTTSTPNGGGEGRLSSTSGGSPPEGGEGGLADQTASAG